VILKAKIKYLKEVFAMKKALIFIFVIICIVIYSDEIQRNFIGKKFTTGMVPTAITVDENENIYIADRFTKSILKYDKKGKYIFSFGIKISEKDEVPFFPIDIFYKDNIIYVLDINGRIYLFNEDGAIIKGKKYNIGKLIGELSGAKAIFVDDEYIYVADSGNNRVQIFDKDGNGVKDFGYKGSFSGVLKNPEGIIVNKNEIVVSDTDNNTVSIFEKNGTFKYNIDENEGENSNFKRPKGVSIGEDGKIYVIDSGNSRVKVYDENYKFLYAFSENKKKKNRESGIADIWFKNKKIYIADGINKRVKVYNQDMKLIAEIGRNELVEILIKTGLIALVIFITIILLKKEKKFKGEE
jgi:DNA-binding beta-propeller fold protein YncE